MTHPPTLSDPTLSASSWQYAQPHQRRLVSYLGAAIMGVAMISILPIVIVLWRSQDPAKAFEFQRWAYALLLLATLQLAYAIYLVQIPDWSSVWVVSIASLLLATAYATLMSIRLLSGDTNGVIRFLDLHDNAYSSGQEAGWCLIMLVLTGLVSYLAGRFGARWYLEQKTVHYDATEN